MTITKHIYDGISVILCCYNSAGRIRNTLTALAKQKFHSAVNWEIVLVDNASSDQTAKLALSCWHELNSEVDLRVVHEPVPGLSHARQRGITESNNAILVFCDDDNWLSPSYLEDVYRIFQNDSSVAACGGRGLPVFETARPEWFDEYEEAFALGSQEINKENGRILNLYGAGLSIRRNIIDKLHRAGFNPLMQGRVKNKLSSSEDTELTYACVLMGYKLHYDEKLKFYHYLPKERLTYDYLKKLFIAFGSDGPVRNLYYANISARPIHQKTFYRMRIGRTGEKSLLCQYQRSSNPSKNKKLEYPFQPKPFSPGEILYRSTKKIWKVHLFQLEPRLYQAAVVD